MEVSVLKLCSVVLAIVITTWACRVVNWVWVRPRRIQKCLRKQGFKGNSYRLLFGDLKENFSMTKEARSKPINLSDDIATRVVPFVLRTVHTYGPRSGGGFSVGTSVFSTAWLQCLDIGPFSSLLGFGGSKPSFYRQLLTSSNKSHND